MKRARGIEYGHGGYLHLTFIVLLGIGAFTASNADDPPVRPARCEPSTVADPYLLDAGWVTRGGLTYPPGCETTP